MKHDSFFSANARPTPDLRFCFIHVYCKYLMKGGINTLNLRKILPHGLCIILVLIVLLIGWLAYMFLGTNSRSTDDMSYYMTISKQSDGHTALPILRQRLKVHCPYDLPKQEYLDSCLDYRFDHTAKRMGPFCSFAYTLICEFSEDAYAAEKASLDSLYTYTTRQYRVTAPVSSPNMNSTDSTSVPSKADITRMKCCSSATVTVPTKSPISTSTTKIWIMYLLLCLISSMRIPDGTI